MADGSSFSSRKRVQCSDGKKLRPARRGFGPAAGLLVLPPRGTCSATCLVEEGMDRSRGHHDGRVFVTLGVLVVLWSLGWVPVPGLDPMGGSFPAAWPAPMPALSIGSLGILPWITATVLVELWTLLIASGGQLRRGFPSGRVGLEKAARWIWPLCAATAAFTLVVVVEHGGVPGGEIGLTMRSETFEWLTGATLVGGGAVFVLGDQLIRARGLGNGAVWLLLLKGFPSAVAWLHVGDLFEERGRRVLLPTLLSLVCCAAGSVWLLRRSEGRMPAFTGGARPPRGATLGVCPGRSGGVACPSGPRRGGCGLVDLRRLRGAAHGGSARCGGHPLASAWSALPDVV